MRDVDILAYAVHCVGFPIAVGDIVIIDEDTLGYDQYRYLGTAEKGSHAKVTSIRMMTFPHQLSIGVTIDLPEGRVIKTSFNEADDDDRPFPLLQVKTEKEPPAVATEGKDDPQSGVQCH